MDSITTWPGRSGFWALHASGVVVHAETTDARDEATVALAEILGGAK